MKFIILIVFIVFLLVFSWYKRKKWRKEINYRNQRRKNYKFIYFYRGRFENPFFVKCGKTKEMKKRMGSAKTPNTFGIFLLGVIRVKDDTFAESLIHDKFKFWRVTPKNEKNWILRKLAQYHSEWFFYPAMMYYMYCIRDNKLTKEFRKNLKL